MTTTELKKKLIDTINSTENASVLEDIERILDLEFDSDVFMISAEQKTAIIQGQKDFKSGNYISNDEANDQINKWLQE